MLAVSKMKSKILIYSVVVFILLLIQSTILNYIRIYNVKPNLILVFIIAVSLLRGSLEGAVLGFFAGLAQDMLSGKAIGIYALLGMYAGLISGSVNKRLYRENILVCVFFTFIISIVYEFIIFMPTAIFNGYENIPYVLKRIILPEAIYNSAFSVIIFILAVKISYSMESVRKKARKY